MTHKLRVFAAHKEFIVEAAVHSGSPGMLTGPWEDCYPPDPGEVEVDSIAVKLGSRKRLIDWDKLDPFYQDAIIGDIIEQWGESLASDRAEEAERRYDAHLDR